MWEHYHPLFAAINTADAHASVHAAKTVQELAGILKGLALQEQDNVDKMVADFQRLYEGQNADDNVEELKAIVTAHAEGDDFFVRADAHGHWLWATSRDTPADQWNPYAPAEDEYPEEPDPQEIIDAVLADPAMKEAYQKALSEEVRVILLQKIHGPVDEQVLQQIIHEYVEDL